MRHFYYTHTIVITAEVKVESQNFDPSDAGIQGLIVERLEEKQPYWDTEVIDSVKDEK